MATKKKAATKAPSSTTAKPFYVWGDNIGDVGYEEYTSKAAALDDMEDNLEEDNGVVHLYEVRVVGSYKMRSTVSLEEVK